jgi:hypothetical protein
MGWFSSTSEGSAPKKVASKSRNPAPDKAVTLKPQRWSTHDKSGTLKKPDSPDTLMFPEINKPYKNGAEHPEQHRENAYAKGKNQFPRDSNKIDLNNAEYHWGRAVGEGMDRGVGKPPKKPREWQPVNLPNQGSISKAKQSAPVTTDKQKAKQNGDKILADLGFLKVSDDRWRKP